MDTNNWMHCCSCCLESYVHVGVEGCTDIWLYLCPTESVEVLQEEQIVLPGEPDERSLKEDLNTRQLRQLHSSCLLMRK